MGNAWWINHIYAGFTGTMDLALVDGKYVANYEASGFRDSIKYLNKLCENGVLDREIYRHTADSDELAKFVSGCAGVLLTNFAYLEDLTKQMKQYNSEAEIAWLPTDFKGHVVNMRGSGTKFYDGFAINSETKNPERILCFFEFLCTEEMDDLSINGVPGVHYTLDATGNKVKNEEIFKKEEWGLDGLASTNGKMRQFMTGTPILEDELIKKLTSDVEGYKNFTAISTNQAVQVIHHGGISQLNQRKQIPFLSHKAKFFQMMIISHIKFQMNIHRQVPGFL